MGTSHSAISRIESGQHSTSVQTLQRLAAALEMRFVMGSSMARPRSPCASSSRPNLDLSAARRSALAQVGSGQAARTAGAEVGRSRRSHRRQSERPIAFEG